MRPLAIALGCHSIIFPKMKLMLWLFSIQPSSTNATIAASVSEVSESHMRPLPIIHLDCHSAVVFTDMKLLRMCFI